MDKVFAIGDIHGSYHLLDKILNYWNPEEELLVFLGDYIDRGRDSLRVLRKVMELSEKHKVVTLSGNHEQIFMNWLKKPKEMSDFYFDPKVGGVSTVQSFFSALDQKLSPEDLSGEQIVEIIKEQFPDEVEFIKNLRLYYYWKPYLFVHAGINPDVEDFLETSSDEFLWIREEFSKVPHRAKEIVVFGHTPTIFLNEDGSSKVWISPCRKKIGIDGGGEIYPDGKIHGVRFYKNSSRIDIYSANDKEISTSHFTL
ncbi:metallophosphoesterase family protein [Ureibacillus sp. FSL K6-8385]|uniref:Serine/threonine protein phosphatase n=1 Tax=Ureibacillus terrenus TaxID=118246 RepID=A0A540V0Q9_9BACL|nr:metallophosphoesterase family protein [Ureibacillus terrenus]MED3661423.1 metallophosphoesterase family protein [Ureibacillus terrenus]MED3763259.1 metallophosphoesterase family protein [Ureibacillus terrenus]TQE90315.1 serine/threonine protein phosphatase [Ureibacillus terrenus]